MQLPAQVCKFHKEFELAEKPGTYLNGVLNSTEHIENSFYHMKFQLRANDQKKNMFMRSFMDNQSLGTTVISVCFVGIGLGGGGKTVCVLKK